MNAAEIQGGASVTCLGSVALTPAAWGQAVPPKLHEPAEVISSPQCAGLLSSRQHRLRTPVDLVAHAPELVENFLFRRRGVRIIEAPVIPPVELSPRTCVAGFSLTPFGLVDPFRVGRAQSSCVTATAVSHPTAFNASTRSASPIKGGGPAYASPTARAAADATSPVV